MDDRALLERYVRERSDEAFGAIVARHLDMVYAAACRHLGDSHLAEDAAQGVFVLLAQKADILPAETLVAGWLYNATKLICANLRKMEYRRRKYESAGGSRPESLDGTDPTFGEVPNLQEAAPLLDDAMTILSDGERAVVVLQFLENKSLREVAHILNISEDSARQRSSRAVRRMRSHVEKRGMKLTPNAMCAALLALSWHQAPPTLVGKTTAIAIASTPAAVLPSSVAAATHLAAPMLAKTAAAPLGAAWISGIIVSIMAVVTGAFVLGYWARGSNPASDQLAHVSPTKTPPAKAPEPVRPATVEPPVNKTTPVVPATMTAEPVIPPVPATMAAIDARTPPGAADAYHKGMTARIMGDERTLREFYYARTPEEAAAVASLIARDKAVYDLRKLLELRYDMTTRIALPRGGITPAELPQLEQLRVDGEGTRVLVTMPRHVSGPMIFVDGRWRYDMSRMPEIYRISRGEIMRQDQEVTTIFTTVLDMANKGTFKTYQEAINKINELLSPPKRP